MRRHVLAIGSAALLGAASVTTLGMVADRPAAPLRQQMPGPEAASLLGGLPLSFVENVGQSPEWVSYSLHGAASPVAFARHGVALSLSGGEGRWGVGVRFVGAEPTQPIARAEAAGTISYFRGQQSQWATGLPTYSRLVYDELWPGIDLVYSGTSGRLKYSFRVAPGADPSDIRLGWRGVRGLRIDEMNRLRVDTPAGEVLDDAPYTYQVEGGGRVEIPSSYEVVGRSGTGFDVGAYDPRRPLVIDPATFVYAGYLGGQDGGVASSVAVDASGATYVAGATPSTQSTFPDGDGFGAVPGPDTSHNGQTDAFVVKIDPSGTSLVYAGYLGGADSDHANGIAVDGSGAAYVVGDTTSDQASFPDIAGPDLTINGDQDAFVARVEPGGTSLSYAGYVGGSLTEFGDGIALDPGGSAYITGYTQSTETSFPDGTDDGSDGDAFDTIPGVDQTHNGSSDVFAVKVGPSGAFSYAGYIGGASFDRGHGIAVDPSGAAYLTGETASDEATFPDGSGTVTIPDGSHNGGFDAYVVKLGPSGTVFQYVGYVGGASGDVGIGIAVDASGAAYLTGFTASDGTTFPDGDGIGALPGPDTSHNGGGGEGYDAFVAKVQPSGASLGYAGFIGGAGDDEAVSIAVDGSGAVHVTGTTPSDQATFPDGDGFGGMPGPDGSFNGGVVPEPTDGFVAGVTPSGASLAYAGYIGGSMDDSANGVAVDASGGVYIVGGTASDQSTFPDGDGIGILPGPDTTYNGDASSEGDGFIVKIADAACRGRAATVVGTEGADALVGTSGSDVIATLGGNDAVTAGGGKDVICTGSGNDAAKGGSGNDQINGESGNDKLTGGSGNDKLRGAAGKDRLKGSSGNDRLAGGGGRDRCSGGGGTDRAPGCEKESGTP